MFEHQDMPEAAESGMASGCTVTFLESAVGAQPGPALMVQLAALVPDELEEHARVLLLEAWERQARWVAAHQSAAMAAVAGPPPGSSEDEDWARASIGPALGLAPGTALCQLAVARALSGRLGATAAALGRGEISALHARALAEETDRLADPVARDVEDRMLQLAGRLTVGRFRRATARAVAAVDPIGTEVAHANAVADRCVEHYAEPDGMATVAARLPAAGAALVMTALTAEAGLTGADDGRGIDARRADVLVGWAEAALASPGLPKRRGHRQTIFVTVDLPTLVGLADNPAELPGYGTIPASMARSLAAGGELRRLVTDPVSGTLLDYGRTTYTPPQALVDFVVARDGTCRFPGCGVPAYLCDLDHGVPFDQGGSTSAENLGALCRRHHRLKTHGGWQLARGPDASVRWTSPAGEIYTVPPTKVLDGW